MVLDLVIYDYSVDIHFLISNTIFNKIKFMKLVSNEVNSKAIRYDSRARHKKPDPQHIPA